VRSFVARCREAPESAEAVVPEAYWSVVKKRGTTDAKDDDTDEHKNDEQVLFRGAVLVRVRGRRSAAAPADAERPPLSPELAAALAEKPTRPGRELLGLLTAGGLVAPGAIILALFVAGLGVTLETLFFRAFFDLGRALELGRQRAGAIGMLFGVIALFLLLDLPIVRGALRLGRHLETRLRMAFLRKIPRLGDRYFQSRLTSDMAERGHAVQRLRLVPDAGESFVRAAAELLFTLVGIIWLDPGSLPLAFAAGALTLGVPLVLLPRLHEWDLRVRNHAGALSRFYLDALLGLFPIRTHGAQKAVRRQHEALLVEWARAMLRLGVANVGADAAVQVFLTVMTVALLFDHLARKGLDGGALLLVYWALKVLTLGHMLILSIATQYPSHRNTVLRLLEPLGAPEEEPSPRVREGLDCHPEGESCEPEGSGGGRSFLLPDPLGRQGSPQDDIGLPHLQSEAILATGAGGEGLPVGLSFAAVTVRAGGHTILEEIDLAIEPGAHVAVVGPSGAGKSTLVGTLLGWHRPASGNIQVDGEPLSAERLARLRRETAWVDPAIHVWNRSLLANLRYGAEDGRENLKPAAAPGVDEAIRAADLAAVLRKLPEGLQTPLGEGGGLVSGGEGQRVRLARALHRPGVRLAVLDEPFRGLDRDKRRELLARSRDLWRDATLLCVTHDVGETLGFERVLVVEAGSIVEDGRPADLAARPGSRYRALLDAEQDVRQDLWKSAVWRHLRMENGRLDETGDRGEDG
jgi:ATP-binding cassette subfamily B protein